MQIKIFNSWQSDSPFNRKAIYDALQLANMEVEKKLGNLEIRIIESNSNAVGTHHIPSNIFTNIAASDIFICDLTLIGKSDSGERKTPNPNVLIELGYAVAHLNWNRIIFLVNKTSGDFKELPFDLEKWSCLGFKVTSENDPNGVGQLKTLLVARITEIIQANPRKPSRDGSEADKKKRENDITVLSAILNSFRIKTMDDFFKDGYKKIDSDIQTGYLELKELMASKAYLVFDEEAKARIQGFRNKLDLLPQLLYTYYDKRRHSGYENKGNKIKDASGAKQLEAARIVIRTIDTAFSALYEYIRQFYHEIESNKYHRYKFEDPDEDSSVFK